MPYGIGIWFSYKSIIGNTDCTIGNHCAQGCAIVNGIEMCYCLSGYQLSTDGISCLGIYENILKIVNWLKWLFAQILMSVINSLVCVFTLVLTLMVPLHVHVTMDMS